MEYNPGDWNRDGCHQDIFAHVSRMDMRPNMRRHIMYEDRWTNDWPGIIRFAGSKVKLVQETIKW